MVPGPPPLQVSSGTWFSDNGNELPGGGEGGGRYAHQCADNADQRYLAGLVRVALEGAGLLGDDMTVPSTAVYGIRDIVGTGPQVVHEDWGKEVTSRYANEPTSMPLSTIWACSGGFKLVREAGDPILMQRGAMVVFRGDFRHGGGGHVTEEFRVHAYVCRKGVHPPRAVYITTRGVETV